MAAAPTNVGVFVVDGRDIANPNVIVSSDGTPNIQLRSPVGKLLKETLVKDLHQKKICMTSDVSKMRYVVIFKLLYASSEYQKTFFRGKKKSKEFYMSGTLTIADSKKKKVLYYSTVEGDSKKFKPDASIQSIAIQNLFALMLENSNMQVRNTSIDYHSVLNKLLYRAADC